MPLVYGVIVIAIVVVIIVAKTATVVPQQSAFVIEHLGKYSRTLQAGFHILVPFFERVAYRHSLKEIATDIPEQICITRDNVQVGVDAVLYMQVLDPHLASYGISQLRLRHRAARANDPAQRDRQDRARSHLRGARRDQCQCSGRARQGLRGLGRQSPALRDQEHHAAEGRAFRDGEADARRARKARRGADLGRRSRRQDQFGGGRQAAGDQAVRGQQATADQRGGRAGAGHSRGRERNRGGPPPGRVSRSPTAAASRPCSCVSARNT